jgi:hypothetical protein
LTGEFQFPSRGLDRTPTFPPHFKQEAPRDSAEKPSGNGATFETAISAAFKEKKIDLLAVAAPAEHAETQASPVKDKEASEELESDFSEGEKITLNNRLERGDAVQETCLTHLNKQKSYVIRRIGEAKTAIELLRNKHSKNVTRFEDFEKRLEKGEDSKQLIGTLNNLIEKMRDQKKLYIAAREKNDIIKDSVNTQQVSTEDRVKDELTKYCFHSSCDLRNAFKKAKRAKKKQKKDTNSDSQAEKTEPEAKV